MKSFVFFLCLCLSVMVHAQVIKNITISTPGTLSGRLTPAEKGSITILEIVGVIDARDFRTMRDEMPYLGVVNLMGTQVVSYYGPLGPIMGTNVFYPANTVPEIAFYNPATGGKKTLGLVYLPFSVRAIGNLAFAECSNLNDINLNNIATIGTYAFSQCFLLKNLSLGSLLNSIGNYAFSNCSKLSSIVFPSLLSSIGIGAFKDCSQLCSIIIPSSLTNIGSSAFQNCSSLASITALGTTPPNIENAPDVFLGINKSSCCLYVPGGCAEIYRSAIQWNEFITIIELGNLVEVSAGGLSAKFTLEERDTLTQLCLMGTIDARDFKTMRDSMPMLKELDLRRVTINSYNGTEGTVTGTVSYQGNTIPKNAFYKQVDQTGKNSLTSFIFPDNTLNIDDFAFKNCNGLTSVSISPQVVFIGYYVFTNCQNLTEVFIPASVTNIRLYAFYRCYGEINVDARNKVFSSIDGVLFNKSQNILEQCPVSKKGHYYIPAAVDTIMEGAFDECSLLTSVAIPGAVKKILSFSFFNCLNLKSIYSYSSIPVELSSSYEVFEGVDKTNCILYVPLHSKSAYQQSNQWKDFSNIVEIPGFLLSDTSLEIEGNGEVVDSILISSYTSWSVTTDQSWLAINHPAGSGDDTLIFSAEANPTSAFRTATVTVSATGFPSQTITVTQAAGEGGVPVNTTLSGINLTSGITECYNALDTVTVSGDGTTVVLENNSSATLIAGKTIRFLPGFHAQEGSEMSAYITTDGTFCEGITAPIVALPEPKSLEQNDEQLPEKGLLTENQVKVYPNPNNGNFIVESTFEGENFLEIFSLKGQKIIDPKLFYGSVQIDLSGLPGGIYLCRVQNQYGVQNRKIQVK